MTRLIKKILSILAKYWSVIFVVCFFMMVSIDIEGCIVKRIDRKTEKLKEGDFIYLEASEYDIYSDGEIIYTIPTDKDSIISFKDTSESSFEGLELSTKRGIQIGSTLDEFKEAYMGIPGFIMERRYDERFFDLRKKAYEEDEICFEIDKRLISNGILTTGGIKYATHIYDDVVDKDYYRLEVSEMHFLKSGYYSLPNGEYDLVSDHYSIEFIFRYELIEDIVIRLE